MKIAINGLGRIGRLVFRSAILKNHHKIVALNSPGDLQTICHLINYDSVHSRSEIAVTMKDENLVVRGSNIPVSHYSNPADISWQDLDVDVVLDCSGRFLEREQASIYLAKGAKKILISAPAKDVDRVVVMGVNHQNIIKNDKIISIGSCTTNALAPVAKVIYDNFGIEAGYVTTIHAYTSDQNIVDGSHQDLRRARSAFTSIIPTSTGAASTIGLIIPELNGKLDGSAIRVPTANVSLIDFTFNSSKQMEVLSLNEQMAIASEGYLKGILGIAEAKLVSVDYNHSSYSSIFDPFETRIVNPYFARILSWYDNEWAFAQRMLDCCDVLEEFL